MLKLVLKEYQNVWISSDTHFGHSNLCKATTKWRDPKGNIPNNVRDFSSLDEMNSTIVDNINNVVKEDDIYLNLGDWSFGGFDNIKKFRDRIICKNIYLVAGNHDEKIIANKDNIRSIFTDFYKDHYLELEVIQGGDKYRFVISHFPIASWNNMAKGIPHLHGHVHLPPNQRLGKGKSLDVGLDGNNMKPYSLSEINNLLKDQPVRPLVLPSDHHADEWKEI